MKIALIGYGKMGKELEKVALSRGHEIVCIIDINNQEDFESEAFKSADVAIEFTNPTVAYSNYMKAFKAGVKLVSGSTGWMSEHGEEIKKLCTEGGKTLFWSSNFSLGVAIFSAVNKYLAKIMNQFPAYDVTMSETHHIHKLDAPSGTAITLAEGILENIDRKDKWVEGTLRHRTEQSAEQQTALRTNFRSVLSAKVKFSVFILFVMSLILTAFQSLTMPRTGAVSYSELYWPPNTPRITKVSWE